MYDEWFEVLFEIKYAHQIINVIKSFYILQVYI